MAARSRDRGERDGEKREQVGEWVGGAEGLVVLFAQGRGREEGGPARRGVRHGHGGMAPVEGERRRRFADNPLEYLFPSRIGPFQF